MAMAPDLKRLVEAFAADLEKIVTRRANEAFAARFDDVKLRLVGERSSLPARSGKVAARIGRPAGKKSYGPSSDKPCPVCGKPNTGRRFSYLCEDHRSADNLAKFKGASRKAAASPEGAPAVKRRPGRPAKAT